MNSLKTYQLEKKYLDLLDIITLYDIGVREHRVPMYVMDCLEEHVKELNSQSDDELFRVERSPVHLGNRLYEVFKLKNVGDLTLFGVDIPVPDGYEVVKKEVPDDEQNE